MLLIVWCGSKSFPLNFEGSGCRRSASGCETFGRLRRWTELDFDEIVVLSFGQEGTAKEETRYHFRAFAATKPKTPFRLFTDPAAFGQVFTPGAASLNVLSQVLSWIERGVKGAFCKDVVAVVALAAIAQKAAKICVQVDLSVEPFHATEILKDRFLLQSYGFLMERGATNAIPYENSVVAVSKEGADNFGRYLIDPCVSSPPRRRKCFFYFHYLHLVLQLLIARRQILKVQNHPSWNQLKTQDAIENAVDVNLLFSTGDSRDDSAWVVPNQGSSVSSAVLHCDRPYEVPAQSLFPTLMWPEAVPKLHTRESLELLVSAMCSAGRAISWKFEGSRRTRTIRIESSNHSESAAFNIDRRYLAGIDKNPCLGVMLLGMMPKIPLFSSEKIYNRPSGEEQSFKIFPVREGTSMLWLRMGSEDERDRTWIEELNYEEISVWDDEFCLGIISWGLEPACLYVCIARIALKPHLSRAVEYFCEQVFGRSILVTYGASWLTTSIARLVNDACEGSKQRSSPDTATPDLHEPGKTPYFGGMYPKTDSCAASLAVLLETLLFLPPRPSQPLRRYVNYHQRLLSFQKENLTHRYVWSEDLWGRARVHEHDCVSSTSGLEHEPGGDYGAKSGGSFSDAANKHMNQTKLGCLGARHHLDVVQPLTQIST